MALRKLEELGWRTLSVWECEIKARSREEIETLLVRCHNWLISSPGVVSP
jgi:G:T-mismatch repair DNA endonuclease (very short patch repair protein)